MAPATSLFPPFTTVRTDSSGQYYFYSWRDTGVFDRMMEVLRDLARAEADLEPIVVQVGAAKDGFFGSIQDRDSAPGPEAPTKPSLSDLRDPRAAGEGSNGREAVGRWCLCGTETSGEVKEVGTLRTARDRGQTQGRDPKSPSLRTFAWLGRCRRLANPKSPFLDFEIRAKARIRPSNCCQFVGLGETGRLPIHDATGSKIPTGWRDWLIPGMMTFLQTLRRFGVVPPRRCSIREASRVPKSEGGHDLRERIGLIYFTEFISPKKPSISVGWMNVSW